MDKSIVSPESGREKWISFERAADLVLLDMPPTCTLLDARTRVALLAEDETLRCRDLHTGDKVVPVAPVGRDGRHLGKLIPEVEIELRSFQRYLLRMCKLGKSALTVDDIRNLGNEDVDLVEVLERRLLTTATAGRESAPAADNQNKSGRPIKAAIPAAMVEATLKLVDEGSASKSDVARWITEAVEAQGDTIGVTQASEYAAVALRLFNNWKNVGK